LDVNVLDSPDALVSLSYDSLPEKNFPHFIRKTGCVGF